MIHNALYVGSEDEVNSHTVATNVKCYVVL